MKPFTCAAITTIFLTLLAGCSLSKSNQQSTPTNSPQADSHQSAATSTPSSTTTDARSNPTPNASPANDELHTPEKGSAERQAIMDTLRGNQQVVFQVNYLKVHNGWCWVDTTPLDKQGRPTAEGGPNLLHLAGDKWKVMDLAKVPDAPNDPLGPEDASPTYIRNVMKTFPGVPRDIFPKASK